MIRTCLCTTCCRWLSYRCCTAGSGRASCGSSPPAANADNAARSARVGDQPITLSARECIVLQYLMLKTDSVVTREQLMETLGICTYMGGGPSLMYAAEAVRAFDEFTAGAAKPAE